MSATKYANASRAVAFTLASIAPWQGNLWKKGEDAMKAAADLKQ